MLFHNGFGIFWLVMAAIAIVPFWRLCQRVGYSPWLSLLIVVPLLNIGFVYYLAFSEWPSRKSDSGPLSSVRAREDQSSAGIAPCSAGAARDRRAQTSVRGHPARSGASGLPAGPCSGQTGADQVRWT